MTNNYKEKKDIIALNDIENKIKKFNFNDNIINSNISKKKHFKIKKYRYIKKNENNKTLEWINEFNNNLDKYLEALGIPSTKPDKN